MTDNYRLVQENVWTDELARVIGDATRQAKNCASDRELRALSFRLDVGKDGITDRFDVYVQASYGDPTPRIGISQ